MPQLSILYGKTTQDIMDSVRRLTNDSDSQKPAIYEHTLREMVIAEFIFLMHELGADPRTPTRPLTGNSMLSYVLAAGVYQTTVEGSSDVIAVDKIFTDRNSVPLVFKPRAELENLINVDLRLKGVVDRSDPPAYWTIKIEQANVAASQAEMQHSMLVYPAPAVQTTVYWPRSIADIAVPDPTQQGRLYVSYQAQYALEYKVAALCIRAMSAEARARCAVDLPMADGYWGVYQQAVAQELNERAHSYLLDEISERTV